MVTRDQKAIGLPIKPFLYTVDQLSVVLDMSEEAILKKLLYFEGRSIGVRPRDKMKARNIAPAGERAEWRVAEIELIRWLKLKGFRWYEKSYLRD